MAVGISLSGLVAAVSNNGGIGVLGTAGLGFMEEDYRKNFFNANLRALKKQIDLIRQKTKGLFGVNIMVALTNYKEIVQTAVDKSVDIIFSGAGLPLDLPQFVPEDSKTRLVPIVSSLKAAKVIVRSWTRHYKRLPDAFVLEGPKAGGHLGFKPQALKRENDDFFSVTVPAIRQFLDGIEEKRIPLIAGGGIWDKADYERVRTLGADGVQMGTAFVATEECDVHPRFKEAYINADEDDVMIIKSPVGMPGRAIRNQFLEDVENGIKKPFTCPYKCIKTCVFDKAPYCIALALYNASRGNLEEGFAFAGSNVSHVDSIITVRDVFNRVFSDG